MTDTKTLDISKIVYVVIALAGAVAAGWGGHSWLRSQIDKALSESEFQNQLNSLLEYTDGLQSESQNQEPVLLSEDGRRILNALVANSKGIGFGVAVYPFESVVQDLGMQDKASAAIAELQEHDFVELADEEGRSLLSGETTTYPVYRVTADGFRWIRNAGRNP